MKVYINYPNERITTHRLPACGHVQQHAKPGQRYRGITIDTLSVELRMFIDQSHAFASQQGLNDMWLELDLGDVALEDAVLDFIRKALAARYKPFQRVVIESHCRESAV